MELKLPLSNLLTKVGRIVMRDYQQAVTPYGITASQAGIVYLLSRTGGLSQVETAAFLKLEKTNINAMVKKLEKAGLVTVGKDPADGRRSVVLLTEKGHELSGHLLEVDRRVEEKYLSLAEDDEDIAVIRKYLEKIYFSH